jgi:hypothetical protein
MCVLLLVLKIMFKEKLPDLLLGVGRIIPR